MLALIADVANNMGSRVDVTRNGSQSVASFVSTTAVARIIMLLTLIGCGRAPDAMPSSSSTGSTGENTAVTSAADVTLEVVSWDQVQAAVAGHHGKIVVLDLWSTYCPPCMKELPGLVQLQRERDDVVCISLCCNYSGVGEPAEEAEPALTFLKSVNATLENYLCSDVDQELYQQLDIATVPVVYVYDRNGQLSKRFDNESDEYGDEGFTYAGQIVPYISEISSQ